MEVLKPSAAHVEEQLARIVASPQFRESPRLQTFLQFVVALTLEGKADQIKESTISSEVFGRADMPDDSIVRSAARRLRTRLEEYYRQAGIGDPVHIAIPKGSYVPEIEERPSRDSPRVAEEPAAGKLPEIAQTARAAPKRRWVIRRAHRVLRCWRSLVRLVLAPCFVSFRSRKSTRLHRPATLVNPVAHDFVMKGRFDLQRVTTEA